MITMLAGGSSTAGLDIIALAVGSRNSVSGRQRHNPFPLGQEEPASTANQCASPALDERCVPKQQPVPPYTNVVSYPERIGARAPPYVLQWRWKVSPRSTGHQESSGRAGALKCRIAQNCWVAMVAMPAADARLGIRAIEASRAPAGQPQ